MDVKIRGYEIMRPGSRMRPHHGPQTWPWWRLVTVHVVRASSQQLAWNIWIYTRWGAWCWGWYPRKKRA